MLAVLVALLVPLAHGEAGAPRAGADWEARNAARARAGLLPRKAPPRTRTSRPGPRAVPASAHESGHPAPAPLAEERPGSGASDGRGPGLRVTATGLRATVRIVLR